MFKLNLFHQYKPRHLIRWGGLLLLGLSLIAVIITLVIKLRTPDLDSKPHFNNSQQQSEPYDAVIERDDPAFLEQEKQFTGQQHAQSNLPELVHSHTVTDGQSLKTIFDLYGLKSADLLALIKANSTALQIKDNQVIEWQLTSTGKIASLSIFRTPKLVSQFRWENGQYQYRPLRKKGIHKTRIYRASMEGNFFHTASDIGLTPPQIRSIYQALYWDIDVTRQAKLGDQLKVAIAQNVIGNQIVGQGKVIGVSYRTQHQHWLLLRADNGQFYAPDGSSNQKTLRRWPLSQPYRISSDFNPQRLNPVTHRIAPHYGTDLAVPVATPVLATGEGQVVRVGEHPLAGLYVVIKNGPIYSTRFLHLSRILVKVGQQVHQNEVIALSGNTGRSTGPHLHYELRKEGVPVNAMLAPLPQASGLTQRQSAQFKQKNRVLIHQLSDPL